MAKLPQKSKRGGVFFDFGKRKPRPSTVIERKGSISESMGPRREEMKSTGIKW